MKVLCIAGLPASGKSFLANELLKTSYKDYILFDDISELEDLGNSLKANINCIITDPYFCISKVRDYAIFFLSKFNSEISWIFFENDPVQCLINAKARKNKLVDGFIKQLTKNYIIPNNSSIKKVFKE